MALSFLALGKNGKKRRCPPEAKTGGFLNEGQQHMVQTLMLRLRSMSRLADAEAGCGVRLRRLGGLLAQLQQQLMHVDIVPYTSKKVTHGLKESGVRGAAPPVPLLAEKVAFPSELRGFDPKPFLPPMFCKAFDSPDSLVQPQDRWRNKPRLRAFAKRTELHKLGMRWDKVCRLALALPQEVQQDLRSEVFCLHKGDGELRQIIDRRRRNAVECPPPGLASRMGHPGSLVKLVLSPSEVLLGSMDDIRNFYHEFSCSLERGLSTPVGGPWKAGDWASSHAYQALVARHPPGTIAPSTPVYMCFNGLSMGDHWAPAIAQLAHENVLRAGGAMDPDEELIPGGPLPPAQHGHMSGVCIDDRLSIQVFPRAQFRKRKAHLWLRDLECASQAERAYQAVGLTPHPRKKVRREVVFTGWGAQVEGDRGLLGAQRCKIGALCMLTVAAASIRGLDQKSLECLLGSWAFCFQFRRCLFSLFQHVYHQGPPVDGTRTLQRD